MRQYPSLWAGALLSVLMLVHSGAAQEKVAPISRRSPVTEAVTKTKAAIVTVKVPRPSGGKDMVGTGVIIDESGYIVTNRHVVGGSKRVKIQMHDGVTVQGDVVATEASWDLAVVQIRVERSLQALPLGPADDLMVGEMVIAIGHPYGYRNTVSTGIISALDREIEMPTGDVLTGLIQTDASINPGNSGGPLLNINGELIGINVALREGAQGIAFAINSGSVKKVLSRHLSAAKLAGVDHGLVCKEEVTAETGPRQKVIVQASHAEMSGSLNPGDQIVAVGKRGVVNSFDIERAMWNRKPGESVELHVIRDGKELTVNMTLRSGHGTAPAFDAARRNVTGAPVGIAASDRR